MDKIKESNRGWPKEGSFELCDQRIEGKPTLELEFECKGKWDYSLGRRNSNQNIFKKKSVSFVY